MFRLLTVAVVAGLVAGAQTLDIRGSLLHSIVPIKPDCTYHPTHIKCWTEWFDRDNPSATGDWETLSDFLKEIPKKICEKPSGIEVQTVSGGSVAGTGDIISRNDLTGFVCLNKDQPNEKMCSDYRVRFSCYKPFCAGFGGDSPKRINAPIPTGFPFSEWNFRANVCWTKWYDRDNPSGTGDWETLSHLREDHPGQICAAPLYIEAVTSDTMTPATSTGENFSAFSPSAGLVCRNTDQKDSRCQDYKVRFGCPC